MEQVSVNLFDAYFDSAYAGEMTTSVVVPASDPLFLASMERIDEPTVRLKLAAPVKAKKKSISSMIQPAYDDNGKANFLDDQGRLLVGIYDGIPNDIYHQLKAYSSSHFKTYANSPAHYEAKYLTENDKPFLRDRSLDIGSISHEIVLEGIDVFHERRFVLIEPSSYPYDLHSSADLKAECERLGVKSSGTMYERALRIVSKKEAKTYFDFRQINLIRENIGEICFKEIEGILKDNDANLTSDERLKVIKSGTLSIEPKKLPVHANDYSQALKLSESLKRNKTAIKLLENGVPEVSFIVKDPISGLLLKCRVDWLSALGDVIIPVDLKTTRSANPVMASYQFADLRYDLQAAFYLYVIGLSGLPVIPRQFPFVTLETGDVSICEVFELDSRDWDEVEEVLPKLIKHFKSFLSNKVFSGYTKSGVSTLKLAKRKNAFFIT
jgi:uncharacterized protein YqkB